MPAILRMRSFAALSLMLAAVLVVSMASLATPAEAASKQRLKRIQHASKIVGNQKGDPYRWGATGPSAFDCSGLIYFSYRKAGLHNVPRTSDQQARFAKRIKRKNMRRGDLVFFHNGGDVYHVGMFAGRKHGKRFIVHAPYGGKRVHRSPIWANNWFAGTLR